ncbi:hypothetical protein WISP_138613 [Willisornis vidua]|uniref:Uncharacterized protein n=1 Tax=Willisornis vidua TaxID=1566151 RepID=A0ABQ9CSU3_9PASS|nr:hypothetical protein WISP_138613 [Willisornis vidua]
MYKELLMSGRAFGRRKALQMLSSRDFYQALEQKQGATSSAKAGCGVHYVLAAGAGEMPEDQDLAKYGGDWHSRPAWKYLAGSSVQCFAPHCLSGRAASEAK